MSLEASMKIKFHTKFYKANDNKFRIRYIKKDYFKTAMETIFAQFNARTDVKICISCLKAVLLVFDL